MSAGTFDIKQIDGVKVIKLDSGGKNRVQLSVVPEFGGNISSIKFKEREVLFTAKSFQEIRKQSSGIKVMYPTPNRVNKANLKFKNYNFEFPKNLGEHFIHGLALKEKWNWSEPIKGEKTVSIEMWRDFSPKDETFKYFPIESRLKIKIVVREGQVRFLITVKNQDSKILPFGFGLHPYFKLHDKRENINLSVPVKNIMEDINLIPTGKLIKLAETKYQDLPLKMDLKTLLNTDSVFFPYEFRKVITLDSKAIKMNITASKGLEHFVLFVPENRELVCLENQTSATDAHNLYEKGFRKESGLIELNPGETWSGQIVYGFE